MKNRNELFIVIATVAVLACMVFSVLGVGTGCSDRTTAMEEEEDDDDDADVPRRKKGGVFATAREKAKQADCVNNLKQIGLAAKQYAGSYDDWFPTTSHTARPRWMNGNSGNSLDILRVQDFLPDPKYYICPSKEGVVAAKPNQTIRGHVSYNWCDGLMDGNSGMSPIACDGLDNHFSSGRFLRGDGSVSTATATSSKSWTQDPIFKDSCYDKEPPEYSF